MRTILPAALLAVLALFARAEAGGQFARSMAGQFSVTSEQGWPGRRYVEGGIVFAEEFDTNQDNRIDLWRFYRRGVLSSEEQDLDFDGRVDLVTAWNTDNPRVQRLTGVSRDTRGRGAYDLEMEALDGRRWRIQEDRNGDGVADAILEAEGPYQVFENLGLDLGLHPDVIGRVPVEYWIEYRADDGYGGFITDYRRYSRGRQTHYGEWNGRRVTWARHDPNRAPPPSAPAGDVQTPPEASASEPPAADGTSVPDAGAPASPPEAGDPFAAGDGFDPNAGYYYDSGAVVDATPSPPMSDRTRYEGLPPGDSAARSLPARMRPPGVGPRR